ncbi:MAG: tRNA (guanine-N(1)-)-methyltransferase [Parcubacteria group bacterium GW2011_GWC1_45_9]|nr:MAG: tRNA (guanine-N(1)-)-methyltransferase [Parcubacteria group bacterium GW2011_GWA1_Parcubacteria_45_10]KKT88200.1 MAG: tRNA (guanine-N(1)-)-methyltransferase [Parcubacteria group bacterium GW2011_GWB1_45_10]KKU16835.1 MAG: tRNA (guanine-N(1)-)-methyltransferase [Parcubacteria group bacterium GW2011_GWC1_45_9]HCI05574.1 tRNA (guanosine(37)-N1)-methyltransferase TrmD [Patescibacteria group bacterium]
MKFDIISIFPDSFQSYFSSSIISRAQKSKKISIYLHDLRDWADDRRKTVDDKPYGGGPGMVLKVEPIYKAIKSLCKGFRVKDSRFKKNPKSKIRNLKSRIILLSAKGKLFTQKEAERLKKYKQLVLIAGHYEGVDERVAKFLAQEELSIGKYVLTGGELPAMVVVDAVSRLIPGVLGKQESLANESFSSKDYLEYPQYTRPEIFRASGIRHPKSGIWQVPKILLSGDHKKISLWRERNAKILKKEKET